MSCITQLLEMKGDKAYLPIHEQAVIEGGGSYKGYEYLVTFTRHGNRCGYVAIPDESRDYGNDLDCHGGITFEGRDHGAKNLLPIACNDLWVGFDCAHYMDKHDFETAKKYFGDIDQDIVDSFSRIDSAFDKFTRPNIHRTYQFVEDECKYIIDQVIALEERASGN